MALIKRKELSVVAPLYLVLIDVPKSSSSLQRGGAVPVTSSDGALHYLFSHFLNVISPVSAIIVISFAMFSFVLELLTAALFALTVRSDEFFENIAFSKAIIS